MKMISAFALAFVFLSLSCQKHSDSESFLNDVPFVYRNDMKLGSPVDIVDQRVLPNNCVEGDVQPQNTTTKSNNPPSSSDPSSNPSLASSSTNGRAISKQHVYSFEFVESNEDFSRKIGIDGVLNLSGVLGSASLSAAWLRDNAINSYNTYLLLKSVRDFDPAQLSNVQLKKQYAELLSPSDKTKQPDLARFRNVCGDGFVSHLTRRSEFYALIRVETTTKDSKNEVKSALSAIAGKNFFVEGDAKVDFEHKVSKILQNKSVTITIFSSGGPAGLSIPAKLPDIATLLKTAEEFNKSLQKDESASGSFIQATVHYYSRLIEAEIPKEFRDEFETAVNLYGLARKAEIELLGQRSNLLVVQQSPDQFQLVGEESESSPEQIIAKAKARLDEIRERLESLAAARKKISFSIKANVSAQDAMTPRVSLDEPAQTIHQIMREIQTTEEIITPKKVAIQPLPIEIEQASLYFHPSWMKNLWPDASNPRLVRYGFNYSQSRSGDFICTIQSKIFAKRSGDNGVALEPASATCTFEVTSLPNSSLRKVSCVDRAPFEVYRLDGNIACTPKGNATTVVSASRPISLYVAGEI